jgi:hypothetical protein
MGVNAMTDLMSKEREKSRAKTSAILALSERLRAASRKSKGPLAADLRLAARYLKRLAGYYALDAAVAERDPDERRRLTREALDLLEGARRRGVGARRGCDRDHPNVDA